MPLFGEATLNVLSHYSKNANIPFSVDQIRHDNEHKPGGLWLSDDSDYGWYELVLDQVRSGSSEWADGEELLQNRYDFIVDPRQLDKVLVLRTPAALRGFTLKYQEASPRECEVEGKVGYGRHIEWHRVKTDYKGILITPYQRELPHRRGDPDFHWYRFDCASGCFWDPTCLRPISRPQVPSTETAR